MILTFSKDKFVYDIIAGRKVTTIREDKHGRWKPGMKIYFWKNNPRNKSKNPHCFGEGKCARVVPIRIERCDIYPCLLIYTNGSGQSLTFTEVMNIIHNDGLTLKQFRMWFIPPEKPIFEGKIIYWENCKFK